MSSVFVLDMDGPVREERRSSPARSERQDPTVHRELRAAEPPPEQHLQELDSSAIDLAEETGDASGAQHHEIASQLEGSTPDKCGKCAADFPSLAKMVVKVPTLTGKKPMQWTVCVKLSEVMDLRRRFGVRDAATPLECTFCHTKLPVIDLEKHLISHAFRKPFKRKCSVCHEKFTATESLIAHFRRERMFECKVCDVGFGRAALLAAHLRTHSVDKQMSGQLHRTSSEQDVAQCAACAADYPSLSKMVASVRTHTEQKPLECSVCVTLSEAEKLEGRLTYRRGEMPFECAVCRLKFDETDFLKMHFQSHVAEKPIKCTVCRQNFTASEHLIANFRIHAKKAPAKKLKLSDELSQLEDLNVKFGEVEQTEKHLGLRTETEKPASRHPCNFGDASAQSIQVTSTHSLGEPYKCKICSKQFTHESLLSLHLGYHGIGKFFRCAICSKSFSSRTGLKYHLRTTHEGKNRLLCEFCNKTFALPQTLVAHIRTHERDEPFKCEVCNTALQLPGHLERNIRMHSEETLFEGEVVCSVCHSQNSLRALMPIHASEESQKIPVEDKDCNVELKEESAHRIHIQMHDEWKVSDRENHELQIEKNLDPTIHTRRTKFTCNVCDMHFSDDRTVQTELPAAKPPAEHNGPDLHLKATGLSLPGELQEESSWAGVQQHGTAPVQARIIGLKCSQCAAKFPSISELMAHVPSHTVQKQPENYLKSKDCKRTFSSQRGLRNHSSKIHQWETLLKCKVCSYTFRTAAAFKIHFRTHTGGGLFECQVCSNAFSTATELKHHSRIHSDDIPFKCKVSGNPTGDKLFQCEICHKNFSAREWETHLALHQKVYECSSCHQKFHTLQQFETHIKTTGEDSFVCTICGKKFVRKRNLVEHHKTHTGENNIFECSVCHIRVSSARNLNNHLRIHTGEKPSECKVCRRRFNNKGALTRHRNTIHSEAKPLDCTVCNKKIRDMWSIKHLSQVHMKERFSCAKCNIYFSDESYLRKHISTHTE